MKGCQREMIVLRTKESALFESAYFVLRREREPAREQDMLAEATRLIGGGERKRGERRPRGRLAAFLLGLLSGGGISVLVWGIVCICT